MNTIHDDVIHLETANDFDTGGYCRVMAIDAYFLYPKPYITQNLAISADLSAKDT